MPVSSTFPVYLVSALLMATSAVVAPARAATHTATPQPGHFRWVEDSKLPICTDCFLSAISHNGKNTVFDGGAFNTRVYMNGTQVTPSKQSSKDTLDEVNVTMVTDHGEFYGRGYRMDNTSRDYRYVGWNPSGTVKRMTEVSTFTGPDKGSPMAMSESGDVLLHHNDGRSRYATSQIWRADGHATLLNRPEGWSGPQAFHMAANGTIVGFTVVNKADRRQHPTAWNSAGQLLPDCGDKSVTGGYMGISRNGKHAVASLSVNHEKETWYPATCKPGSAPVKLPLLGTTNWIPTGVDDTGRILGEVVKPHEESDPLKRLPFHRARQTSVAVLLTPGGTPTVLSTLVTGLPKDAQLARAFLINDGRSLFAEVQYADGSLHYGRLKPNS